MAVIMIAVSAKFSPANIWPHSPPKEVSCMMPVDPLKKASTVRDIAMRIADMTQNL